jgi:hypothetical protein
MFDLLDTEAAAGIEGLREFAMQEVFQFRFIHHRLSHGFRHGTPDIRNGVKLRYNAYATRQRLIVMNVQITSGSASPGTATLLLREDKDGIATLTACRRI